MHRRRSASAGNKHLSSLSPEVEYNESGAWYSVRLILRGDTLIVSYLDFSISEDEHINAASFSTSDEIAAFRRRFRAISLQLQDSQCPQVRRGTPVCASCVDGDEATLLFYDAVVDSVKRDQHTSSAEGEEECLCDFILSWISGPKVGTMTLSKIDGICLVQPSSMVDPRLDSFISICVEKLKLCPLSTTAIIQKSTCNIDYEQHEEDYDLGGGCALKANIYRMLPNQSSDCYVISIDNIEKDLSPSTIISFIHKHISIYVKAYIVPSLSTECYTRGVIVVDCAEDFQKLHDFVINNTDQMIISSKGRPWIVAEDSQLKSSSIQFIGSNIEIMEGDPGSELKIIRRGCQEYDTAVQRKGLVLEFRNHQRRLHGRLFAEEITCNALAGCSVGWL